MNSLERLLMYYIGNIVVFITLGIAGFSTIEISLACIVVILFYILIEVTI